MQEQCAGMTVNERLYVSNYMKYFDKAVKNKDVNTVISILKKIEIDDESIHSILIRLKLTGRIKVLFFLF
jgi:hypothetical protein